MDNTNPINPAPVDTMGPQTEVISNSSPMPIPVQDEVQPPVIEPQDKKSNLKYFIAFLVLMLVIGTGVFVKFMFFSKSSETNNGESRFTDSPKDQSFVNCDDIRKFVEDEGKLYVSCLGGVLVLDSTTGKVLNQITSADGLSSPTTTDIVKKGNILYIGTQDGFTEFNLKTWKGKKISVKEGLISGSNIELALQGDTLWVGTFGGVSKYDTKTGNITNYTKELNASSTVTSTRGIFANSNLFAANITANAYSPGGVAFFRDNTWKSFEANAFGEDRVEAFGPLVELNGNLYFSDGNKDVWYINMTSLDSWKKVDGLLEKVRSETDPYAGIRLIGSYSNKLYMISSSNNQTIFSYDPITNEVKSVYPNQMEGQVGLSNYQPVALKGNTIWFKAWSESDSNVLFAKFDLDKVLFTDSLVIDRPIAFYSVSMSINSNPWISAKVGGSIKLVEYNTKTGEFKSKLKTGTYQYVSTGNLVEPVLNTSKIFLSAQECGQGCSKPSFMIYDYSNSTYKELELPGEVSKGLLGSQDLNAYGYNSINVVWKDDTGRFAFATSSEASTYYMFDVNSEEWSIIDKLPEGGMNISSADNIFCNKSYTFKDNIFTNPSTCSDPKMIGEFKFEVVDKKLVQTNKDGSKTTIETPASDPIYSPFETWNDDQAITSVVNDGINLWLLTNRGLVRYNPNNGSTKLFTRMDKLLSNTVESLVVIGNNSFWSTSGWGGLNQVVVSE